MISRTEIWDVKRSGRLALTRNATRAPRHQHQPRICRVWLLVPCSRGCLCPNRHRDTLVVSRPTSPIRSHQVVLRPVLLVRSTRINSVRRATSPHIAAARHRSTGTTTGAEEGEVLPRRRCRSTRGAARLLPLVEGATSDPTGADRPPRPARGQAEQRPLTTFLKRSLGLWLSCRARRSLQVRSSPLTPLLLYAHWR